jgi:hypothetical protein
MEMTRTNGTMFGIIVVLTLLVAALAVDRKSTAQAAGVPQGGGQRCIVPKDWGTFKGAAPFPVFEDSSGTIRVAHCYGQALSLANMELEISRR